MHISIHAAREGGDYEGVLAKTGGTKFQSTPPVKAATPDRLSTLIKQIISIHAAREGGDEGGIFLCGTRQISIHAAREGGDTRRVRLSRGIRHFNPRRP